MEKDKEALRIIHSLIEQMLKAGAFATIADFQKAFDAYQRLKAIVEGEKDSQQ